MGYGIVRPTLGGITSKVLLLGVIYFVASEALELVEHLGNINDFSGKVRLFLVLPVALLDACFILWIFSSLSKTLEKLQVNVTVHFLLLPITKVVTKGTLLPLMELTNAVLVLLNAWQLRVVSHLSYIICESQLFMIFIVYA